MKEILGKKIGMTRIFAETGEMISCTVIEAGPCTVVQKKTGGRVAAMEIMPVTATIRDCIRDKDRMDEISDLIEEGKDHYGSQTFDQHLMELVKKDVVTFELAKSAANNPADFDLKMNMFNDPKAAKGDRSNMQDEMSQLFGGGR